MYTCFSPFLTSFRVFFRKKYEDVGKQYVQVAEFLSNFHSPVEDGDYAWNQDMEYIDYQWRLGRLEDGRWEIVSWGY